MCAPLSIGSGWIFFILNSHIHVNVVLKAASIYIYNIYKHIQICIVLFPRATICSTCACSVVVVDAGGGYDDGGVTTATATAVMTTTATGFHTFFLLLLSFIEFCLAHDNAYMLGWDAQIYHFQLFVSVSIQFTCNYVRFL